VVWLAFGSSVTVVASAHCSIMAWLGARALSVNCGCIAGVAFACVVLFACGASQPTTVFELCLCNLNQQQCWSQ